MWEEAFDRVSPLRGGHAHQGTAHLILTICIMHASAGWHGDAPPPCMPAMEEEKGRERSDPRRYVWPSAWPSKALRPS